MGLLYSLRQFIKNPAFTIVAVLTLSLGIGANTAIFSFVNSWLIHPVLFPHEDRIVMLLETDKKTGERSAVAPADYLDWRAKSQIFEELATGAFDERNLTGIDEPVKLEGYRVSDNFFRTLGAQPAIGRDFKADEMEEGADHVVILSHGLWRDRFSADPAILGRSILLDEVPTRVVGVMPEHFQFIPFGPADFYTPLAFTPAQKISRESRFLRPVARLKPGIGLSAAISAMTTLQASLEQTYSATNANRGVLVKSLKAEIDQQSGNDGVSVCFGIVFFVLMMACANVANLIMTRATGRRKEIAIRMAMGAGRMRLLRQLLGETLLLFTAGAIGGIAFARWGVTYLLNAIPLRSRPYLPHFGQVEVDWQTLGFALAIALVTGLIFGLAPALEGTRLDLNTVLKDSGRGTAGKGSSRFRKVLVAGEMALAVIVVVCAALLVNSFSRLRNLDPGFDAGHVMVAEMQLPPKYETPASIRQFADSLTERMAAVGGVERSAVSMYAPFTDSGGNVASMIIEGQPELPPAQRPMVRRNFISPGYLEGLGIALIAGRTLARQDSPDSTPAVVVNETLAKRYFATGSPLGQHVRFGSNPAYYTIVGVVRDIKYYSLDAPPEDQAYLAFAQAPSHSISLIARSSGDATAIAQSMRTVVHGVDPNLPISRIASLETKIDEQQSGNRILTQVIGFFGLLALLLAAVGIYGVMAYSVSQRVQEIGIRMALGAKAGNVLSLIIRQGMTIILGGMIVGVGGAFLVAKALSQFLIGIQATDIPSFSVSFALLAGVALLACWIPARRAARLDPVIALRNE